MQIDILGGHTQHHRACASQQCSNGDRIPGWTSRCLPCPTSLRGACWDRTGGTRGTRQSQGRPKAGSQNLRGGSEEVSKCFLVAERAGGRVPEAMMNLVRLSLTEAKLDSVRRAHHEQLSLRLTTRKLHHHPPLTRPLSTHLYYASIHRVARLHPSRSPRHRLADPSPSSAPPEPGSVEPAERAGQADPASNDRRYAASFNLARCVRARSPWRAAQRSVALAPAGSAGLPRPCQPRSNPTTGPSTPHPPHA